MKEIQITDEAYYFLELAGGSQSDPGSMAETFLSMGLWLMMNASLLPRGMPSSKEVFSLAGKVYQRKDVAGDDTTALFGG